MNNMIESIARVLRKLTKQNGGVCRGDDENGWHDYIDDAKAVLGAMRTASFAMNDAVFDAGRVNMMNASGDRPEAQMVWSTMIDAALADVPRR